VVFNAIFAQKQYQAKYMSSLSNHPEIPDTSYEKALLMQSMLIAVAKNGGLDENVYSSIRREFMNSDAKSLLPGIIKTCRDEGSVWRYLKKVASGEGSWDRRCGHIDKSFKPFLDYLEKGNHSPSDENISESISLFGANGVHIAWQKALQRRQDDPEGAITAARALLETVCKHILDETGVDYSNDDLPKLYGKTAEALNLAPSQHTEATFKAILGGCYTVVQNLGSLRNKVSDAHGQGKHPVRPLPRHATLAVNLAGGMSTFLIETWNAKNN